MSCLVGSDLCTYNCNCRTLLRIQGSIATIGFSYKRERDTEKLGERKQPEPEMVAVVRQWFEMKIRLKV